MQVLSNNKPKHDRTSARDLGPCNPPREDVDISLDTKCVEAEALFNFFKEDPFGFEGPGEAVATAFSGKVCLPAPSFKFRFDLVGGSSLHSKLAFLRAAAHQADTNYKRQVCNDVENKQTQSFANTISKFDKNPGKLVELLALGRLCSGKLPYGLCRSRLEWWRDNRKSKPIRRGGKDLQPAPWGHIMWIPAGSVPADLRILTFPTICRSK